MASRQKRVRYERTDAYTDYDVDGNLLSPVNENSNGMRNLLLSLISYYMISFALVKPYLPTFCRFVHSITEGAI